MTSVETFDVVIVGGGLAGLTTAALLSKQGKKVVVLEKGMLGGRAITIDLKGFSFNFGAHAIYAKDTSALNTIEKELGLQLEWKSFSKEKAKYDVEKNLTSIPSDVIGLWDTQMINGWNKVKFAWFILNVLWKRYRPNETETVEEWFHHNRIDGEIKNMLYTLASSNFFTNEPHAIKAKDFFSYYERVFRTKSPVSYIVGGWKRIVEELQRVIEENGGKIETKKKVDSVQIQKGVITSILSKEVVYEATEFIFCIPPKELKKVFIDTPLHQEIEVYASYEPSYVMYYDVALQNRIESPLTYVYDTKNKIFVTDISYYDTTTIPENGQLLQTIAYINQKELSDEMAIEKKLEQMEAFYDTHFYGWRDQLVTKRVSKKAIVQEIKSKEGQELMPIHFSSMENVWFAGDWCKGQGQLSELSFSSAKHVVKQITKK